MSLKEKIYLGIKTIVFLFIIALLLFLIFKPCNEKKHRNVSNIVFDMGKKPVKGGSDESDDDPDDSDDDSYYDALSNVDNQQQLINLRRMVDQWARDLQEFKILERENG